MWKHTILSQKLWVLLALFCLAAPAVASSVGGPPIRPFGLLVKSAETQVNGILHAALRRIDKAVEKGDYDLAQAVADKASGQIREHILLARKHVDQGIDLLVRKAGDDPEALRQLEVLRAELHQYLADVEEASIAALNEAAAPPSGGST